MPLGQIVACVMVNKGMKSHKICLNTFIAIAKVKVFHNDDDNDDGDYAIATNTRVMTIPPLFSLKIS